MKKEELVAYIEKELNKGFNPIRIKKKLFDAGHNLIKVEEAFEIVEKKVARRHHRIYGGLAVLVIIIGFILFVNLSGEVVEEMTDSQFLTEAVRNNNPAACEDIVDLELKEKCLLVTEVDEDYS